VKGTADGILDYVGGGTGEDEGQEIKSRIGVKQGNAFTEWKLVREDILHSLNKLPQSQFL
jgi:hypothetical protein